MFAAETSTVTQAAAAALHKAQPRAVLGLQLPAGQRRRLLGSQGKHGSPGLQELTPLGAMR